jgi:hypothetical protein
MSIWNKVLLWLIGLASLGFMVLAARTLQTHAFYMGAVKTLEKNIGSEGLRTGEKGKYVELKTEIDKQLVELHQLLVDRPQVWSNCVAQVTVNKPKATASVVVAFEAPNDVNVKPTPHGISANSTLYAFEESGQKDVPGRYLGEFNVTKADDKQVAMQSAFPLGDLDQKKLSDATGKFWTLYSVMPQDSHEAFASMTEEQKKAVLPAATLTEYLKDGQPADPQDPKERVVDGKYVRQLRDYAQLLNHARQQNTILFDESEATTRDKALVEGSTADAQKHVQFAQNQITDLKSALGKKGKEVDAVANLRKLLEDKLASIEAKIKSLIEENKAMAGQIAQKQLEATRQIDARTRAMAQAPSGIK